MNRLMVRRVRVQGINEHGGVCSPPQYGVIAADDYVTAVNLSFDSREELEGAIADAPSILAVATLYSDSDSANFDGADHDKIGRANYYGDDWRGDWRGDWREDGDEPDVMEGFEDE